MSEKKESTSGQESESSQVDLRSGNHGSLSSKNIATAPYEHPEKQPVALDSAGLHIRCPHCANEVELLVHTPFEEVSCDSCGSAFNLCERDTNTLSATALQKIGRFELVSRLGIGGFGTVWKARDTELDRIVAVKLPRKSQLTDQDVEQFYREARAAAQLRHPNIVPIHEVGRYQDSLFIVSDLIRGVTLSEWLLVKKPSPRETVEICLPVVKALQHAHEQGVIHRDLKPSNVMISEEGQPFLMDFGLAKREYGELTMTIEGQILGTPAYMSPEQADGKARWIDRRTDIYSMGVMLFQMLTGELPFRGSAQMQIHQRLTEDAPSLRKLNRHLPIDLETISLKCLERDPNKRFGSAKELGDELERYLEGLPILSRPLSIFGRFGRWANRKPALAAVGLLTAILAIAGPTTALVINAQRQRIAQTLTERNALIERSAEDLKSNANNIGHLESSLELWEGKANPWTMWPPRAADPPRKDILDKLYAQYFVSWEKLIAAESVEKLPKAYGHLGLGILAQESEHNEEAERYFLVAIKMLTDITADPQEGNAHRQALGDCLVRLATLKSRTNLEESLQLLAKAGETYRQLAEEDNSSSRFYANLLDTELRSAIQLGFDQAAAKLNDAKESREAVLSHVPTEPLEIYQFISHIAGSHRNAGEASKAIDLSEPSTEKTKPRE